MNDAEVGGLSDSAQSTAKNHSSCRVERPDNRTVVRGGVLVQISVCAKSARFHFATPVLEANDRERSSDRGNVQPGQEVKQDTM